MTKTIQISDVLYARLERLAQGFDTPENVLDRLIDTYEKVGTGKTNTAISDVKGQRDLSKYNFNGQPYGKGRLVLAVIEEYVSSNEDVTFDGLKVAFPSELQGSKGVFDLSIEADETYKRTGHKRHFLNPNELITLADSTIAVSTQWGVGNIKRFIEHAKSKGFIIS